MEFGQVAVRLARPLVARRLGRRPLRGCPMAEIIGLVLLDTHGYLTALAKSTDLV